jgi:hypothetical protein
MAKRFKKPDITGDLFGNQAPKVTPKPTPLAKLPKVDRLLTEAEKRKYKQIFQVTPYPYKKLSEFKADIAKRRNKGGTIGL